MRTQGCLRRLVQSRPRGACEKRGKPMVIIKWGRNGYFLACGAEGVAWGVRLRCLTDGCGWTAEPDAEAETPAAPDAKAS